MNFFHAFQYFAIVWWTEKENMAATLRLGRRAWTKAIVLVIFVGGAFAYGLWAKVNEDENDLAFSIVITIAIMHFWYDGFIWSVRKKQV